MSDHALGAVTDASPAREGGRGRAAAGSQANIALFALLFLVALLPVLLTPIPAMVDYVNHLARMHLLVADGTPNASSYYRVVWAFYPNLAMDLVVPVLARMMSVELATRTFLIASEILVVTGAIAIELVVKRRFAVAGYMALLTLFGAPFAWGFVNFVFALGIALWGIAAWIACRDRPWPMRFALHGVFCVLLFLSHMFALGLYGVTLGLHELWAARQCRASWRDLVATTALLSTPVVILAGVMCWTGGGVGQAGNSWFFAAKPFWLVGVLDGYSVVLSVASTAALAILAHLLAKRGALRMLASGGWIAAGLAALYLAIPSRMLDTAFVDLRILVGAVLILPAFIDVAFPSAIWRRAAGGVVAALVFVESVQAASISLDYRSSYAAMIASFDHLGRGARVLVAHSSDADDPPLGDLSQFPIYHAPTLAVAYAGAFVPTLFTTEGKQPLSVRPDMRRLAFSCGGPVPVRTLKEVAAGRSMATTPDFVRTWTRDYDYVYVVGAPSGNPMPDRLEPVAMHDRFALYRVRKAAGG